MRCSTYCTAEKYDIHSLYKNLKETTHVTRFNDALHFKVYDKQLFIGDVFYFDYGVIVFWSLPKEYEKQFLIEIKPYETNCVEEIAFDEFEFSYGELSHIHRDEIILQTKNNLAKLTVSYGLSQSVKLEIFEEKIENTIEKTKHLPQDLSSKGKISLSRKDISKQIGALFIERNSVNLHTDILDTPEFFWEYENLEPLYRKTCIYLDINGRVDVLNKRLNIVHELFEMLSNELNQRHSSKLEWAIIWLIMIEVLIAIFSDILHLI